ncbi:MAG: type II toxin-antitoxin system HicB family antitoxin [Bacteroidales bacterium]|nr:type II toxin-antitoxin system HicB family antitoxin [Bacteroidales bacterium]
MNTLRYKGYIGSVAYSEPDKVFFGKLEGIDDLVNYEGESVAELTAAFEEAVEDYLIFCKEHNVKPEKSYTGTFNVRIAPMAHREIANRASAAGISINAFVKNALDEALHKPFEDTNPYIYKYGIDPPEPAMLMEPESDPVYGESKQSIRLRVPAKDKDFALELAKRMGWEVL